MATDSLAIELPFPPSVNTYWRTFRGRMLISAKGREYRESVLAAVLHADARKHFVGRLRLAVSMYPPDRRRRDVDNFLKATLDALTHAGVYEDDSQIDELTIKRGEVREGGALEVFVDELT